MATRISLGKDDEETELLRRFQERMAKDVAWWGQKKTEPTATTEQSNSNADGVSSKIDALHPDGRCECSGEGTCVWCCSHCPTCGCPLGDLLGGQCDDCIATNDTPPAREVSDE
jgi:hypothetical protein